MVCWDCLCAVWMCAVYIIVFLNCRDVLHVLLVANYHYYVSGIRKLHAHIG